MKSWLRICVVITGIACWTGGAAWVPADEEAATNQSSAATGAGEVNVATESPAAVTGASEATTDTAGGETGFFAWVNEKLKPVDGWFEGVNKKLDGMIFYPIPLSTQDAAGNRQTIGLGVLVLLIGATWFTIRMGFISIRGFKHAVSVIAGKYDNKNSTGEVSHFQALTTALSATVGLGNIAGVTTAIAIGGPGATFWMVLAGFLGMTSKFVECTLGQKYRKVRPDGKIMGGAMYYLSDGLKELGLGGAGKILAIAFAVLCVGGSFAGGNSYQVNGSLDAVSQTLPFLRDYKFVYGLIMVVLTAIVILGGIKRIASTADKIVPVMCGVYVAAGLLILIRNIDQVPGAVSLILSSAFSPDAYRGGFMGVLVWGFRRACFSNEAGVGSAAIAHSAAKSAYPVREGIVALLEPFVDTVVVCTMTALVIVITGAYDYKSETMPPEMKAQFIMKADGSADKLAGGGAALTSLAMDSQIPGFRYVLAFATFMFAYSTIISWSYYGERCWAYLFGDRASLSYKIIFLVFTFCGSVVSAKNMMDFGDLMIFGMMIPNMIGLFLLCNKVRADLDAYWSKLKSGELDREHQERVKSGK